MDLIEIEWEDVDGINQAQERETSAEFLGTRIQ
jgi:hypothetical protein